MAENGRRKRDDALALQLASGQTIRDAAAAAGVGERTATRRCADAFFRRRVIELRAEMVQRALGRMAEGMTEAADVPGELLRAKDDRVRLGAARACLDLSIKLRETVDDEERSQALEARMASEEGR